MMFTAKQKLDAIERELAIRHRVYVGRVANHRMTQKLMDYQIAIFEEIRDDYKKLVESETLI